MGLPVKGLEVLQDAEAQVAMRGLLRPWPSLWGQGAAARLWEAGGPQSRARHR